MMAMHTGGMSADAARRETLSLPASDARLVDKLMIADSLERWALQQLTEVEANASKSAVLRAAFHAGVDRIADLALDEGYRRLAEQVTPAEAAEERELVLSRRRRAREDDE